MGISLKFLVHSEDTLLHACSLHKTSKLPIDWRHFIDVPFRVINPQHLRTAKQHVDWAVQCVASDKPTELNVSESWYVETTVLFQKQCCLSHSFEVLKICRSNFVTYKAVYLLQFCPDFCFYFIWHNFVLCVRYDIYQDLAAGMMTFVQNCLDKLLALLSSNNEVTFVDVCTLCLKKTTQLWNGIARNCKNRFWWYFADMFKTL